MTALLRSELRKITSTRLWWGLLIGAVIYTLIQATASAAIAGVSTGPGAPTTPGLDSAQALRGIYAGSMVTGSYIFAMILGITAMTGEYRYQTVTATFLATPRRERVVLAKMLAQALMGALYAVVAFVAALVAGAVVITIRGHALGLGADGLWRSVGLGILAVAIWGVVGLGIGSLIRNQIAAILTAVFITFLLEPLLSLGLHALGWDWVAKWLPTAAATALTSPAGNEFQHYLDWWAGGLVLLGYGVVFAALGIGLSVRRDIS